MDQSRRVSIIPAFNEEKTIAKVIEALLPYSSVVVVDDCSSDRTSAIAKAAGAEVVTHSMNKGYEGALNSGFKFASERGFQFALTLDADGQHDTSLVNSFFEPLERNECDLVCGVRPKPARFAEWLMGRYFRIFYDVKDPLCGMKSYRMNFYLQVGFFDSKKLVGSELLIRFRRLGARIEQKPIPIFDRDGESRFGSSWRANVKILKALMRAFSI